MLNVSINNVLGIFENCRMKTKRKKRKIVKTEKETKEKKQKHKETNAKRMKKQ